MGAEGTYIRGTYSSQGVREHFLRSDTCAEIHRLCKLSQVKGEQIKVFKPRNNVFEASLEILKNFLWSYECRIGEGRVRPETSSVLWYSHNGVLVSLTDGCHQTQWGKDCLMVKDVGSGRDGHSDWEPYCCSKYKLPDCLKVVSQSEDFIRYAKLPLSFLSGFSACLSRLRVNHHHHPRPSTLQHVQVAEARLPLESFL